METQVYLEKRRKTEKLLDNIYSLPVISEVMYQTAKMLDDPATSTTKLAKMIGQDQGLATKLLSIANSPLYGLPRKVATIDFAILVIGYQDIKNILISLSMMEAFKIKNDENLNYHDLWLHSFLTGTLARRISLDMGFNFGGEAFVAGLLHDMGISVIHKYFQSIFLKVVQYTKTGEKSFLEAEFDELGLTHQEIAKFLAEKWNLPSSLCDAVLYHHAPNKAFVNKELVAVVHLSDYAINSFKLKSFFWENDIYLDPNVVEILRFKDSEHLQNFVISYEDAAREEVKLIKF
ncbi:MAG: HDOD domain-containing protein [Ignavibacteriales bacterium]|nr:HDOD domain-containing protein [Ignavibacteriales bacterium]